MDFSELLQDLDPTFLIEASLFLVACGVGAFALAHILTTMSSPRPGPCKPHAWGIDKHGLICSKCAGRPQEEVRSSADYED